MSIFNPVEGYRTFMTIPPSSAGLVASISSGLYCSMKYVNKAYAVVNIGQGGVETYAITPYQATAVAGTGAKTLSTSVDIWVSSSRSDAPTKRTAATTFTTSTSTGALPHPKQVIFEIDPGLAMDINNGFDCLDIQVTASCSEANVSAYFLLDMRYKEPPASFMRLTSD